MTSNFFHYPTFRCSTRALLSSLAAFTASFLLTSIKQTIEFSAFVRTSFGTLGRPFFFRNNSTYKNDVCILSSQLLHFKTILTCYCRERSPSTKDLSTLEKVGAQKKKSNFLTLALFSGRLLGLMFFDQRRQHFYELFGKFYFPLRNCSVTPNNL